MDWKNAAAWFLLERVMWLLKGLCKFAAADNEHIYSLGADGINFFFLTTFAMDQYNIVCIMAVLGLGVRGGVEIILVASCYGNPGPKETEIHLSISLNGH